MSGIKITELKEKRFRTVTKKDAMGNRTRGREEYTAFREVKTVGAGPRFGHFIIDYIAFQIILIAIGFAMGLVLAVTGQQQAISSTYEFLSQIITLLIYPLMYFTFESAWQRSPGKFLTKCIVINEYGEKPDARTIALRSLLRLVPFEAFSCLGGANGSRGWHDKWSNTWVVTQEELAILKSLQAVQSFS